MVCATGERKFSVHRHRECRGGKKWPLSRSPQDGFSLSSLGGLRGKGDPTEGRWGLKRVPGRLQWETAVLAAIKTPEKTKTWTQQGAYGLPVLAACPPVSTSADSWLPRATRAAPSDVIQARLDRRRSGPPPPEELGGVAREKSAQTRSCGRRAWSDGHGSGLPCRITFIPGYF